MIEFEVQFYRVHRKALKEPRKMADFIEMADMLCRSTKRPLRIPGTNEEWLGDICGANSRWECIGFMFIYLANTVWNLSEADAIYKSLRVTAKGGKRAYSVRLLE